MELDIMKSAMANRLEKVKALILESEQITAREAEIDAELEKVLGTPAKRRGRKPGRKAVAKKRSTRKSKRGPKPGRRTKNESGFSIKDALIKKVLPGGKGDGLDLDECIAGLKKLGIKTTDGTVRQTLIQLVRDNMVRRPDRGTHVLTAKGEKAKGGKPAKKATSKKVAKKKSGKKPAKKKTTKKAAAEPAAAAE